MAETPEKFVEFVKANGSYQNLYLNSPGGNLYAGIQLGRMFRKLSLHVSVGHTPPPLDPESSATYPEPGQCISACSYAFLGGVTRTAAESEIGIHQFSWQLNNFALEKGASIQNAPGSNTSVSISAAQRVAGILIAYAQEMGVDPKFVSVASSTEDIHFLSDSELATFRVSWEAEAFGPWQLKAWGNGLYAFAERSDKTQTIFVYCNSVDKKPKVRIQGVEHLLEIQDRIKDPDYLPIGDALGGQVASAKASQLKGGGAVLDMSLTDFDPKRLAGKSDYDVSIHAKDHSGQWLFEFKLSAKEAAPAISAAMRNCN